MRFEPYRALRQKDEFIHPPPPMIPFVVLFVKNAGCGGLLIWATWLFSAILIMADPILFAAVVIIYLAFKSWHRLILILKSEIEENTLDSLKMIPEYSGRLVKEKLKIASRSNIQLWVMYAVLIIYFISKMGSLYNFQNDLPFYLSILFLPLLKILFDYITFLTVLKVRHAPMAVSMSLISTLTIFYFLVPYSIPLYTFILYLVREKCLNEMDRMTS